MPSFRSLAGTAGLVLLALAVLLGLQLEAYDDAAPVPLDLAASAWADTLREGMPWTLTLAEGLNWVGGGIVAIAVIPLVVVVALLVARRPRAALTAAVAMVASAGAVQVLKWLFDRERPDLMLVTSDAGSFPSGHTANAATLAVLAVAVAASRWRWWVGAVGALYILLMAVRRLVLGVHWCTDVLGGALAGAGAALLVVALLPMVRPPTGVAAQPGA
ncbi:phosphatase PAP2 family protein [Salana multivorans]